MSFLGKNKKGLDGRQQSKPLYLWSVFFEIFATAFPSVAVTEHFAFLSCHDIVPSADIPDFLIFAD